LKKYYFQKKTQVGNKTKKQKKYSGLSGGIDLLIDNNFLNKPKDVNEIVSELKRENFHYPKNSIGKILSVDFTKKKRILTRIKEDKVFSYVVRK